MLNKLTTKQIKLMSEVRDEWINRALHEQKYDKEELEAGVKWMYYASNLKEPKVVIVTGPKDFSKKFGDSVRASVRASVGDSVRASVGDSVRASIWDSVGDSVRASVRDSVRDSVGDSVWDSVWASIWDSVRASVGASVGDSVGASVGDSVGYTSLCIDADDAPWMEYWNKIGIYKDEDGKLKKYLGFLKAGAFYVFFFEKVAFVMLTPKTVKQNDRKQLHSIDGPALEFRDGTKIYKLNGVEFTKEWWTKIVNDKMSPETIFAIDNAEHRRIAYEFMDKKKMKKLKNYEVLDEVSDDGYGYKMKVISFKVKNVDEPLKYLNCFCPSTGREYFLGTNEKECWKAKNKLFGLEEVEYIKEW
jgi:hypothetical protein